MAERPIFLPGPSSGPLVQEVMISFPWHPGMAASQKQKNVAELHRAAQEKGFRPLLEVSSKSDWEVGRRLSAFHLKTRIDSKETTLECAYQGSKVFEYGGPYEDLYWAGSREAKKDGRIRNSGRIISFRLQGEDYPTRPETGFYDWLYLNALYPHKDWLKRIDECAGFTDIEFNPLKSINCQARAVAKFVALCRRNIIDDAVESFGNFLELDTRQRAV